MRTPDGRECPYYYEDFHRGHSTQECRLIGRNPRSERWEPGVCRRCPVPEIARANSCPNMVLEGEIVHRWFGLVRRVEVYAICTEYQVEVDDPYVGCGHCHPQAAQLLSRGER